MSAWVGIQFVRILRVQIHNPIFFHFGLTFQELAFPATELGGEQLAQVSGVSFQLAKSGCQPFRRT